MTKRPTRVQRILAAQERFELAAKFLHSLALTDERFGDALNEYRDALDARKVAEQGEQEMAA